MTQYPGVGKAPGLMEDQWVDPVQGLLPALRDVRALIPILPFLRMLCWAPIGTKLFLPFKLTRKTCVYSVPNDSFPPLMFVYTEIALPFAWPTLSVLNVLCTGRSARSKPRGGFCLPFDGVELLPELSTSFGIPSVC